MSKLRGNRYIPQLNSNHRPLSTTSYYLRAAIIHGYQIDLDMDLDLLAFAQLQQDHKLKNH